MDGINNYATMHIVTNTNNTKELKQNIKEELNEHGISHTTIEIETTDECCNEEECHIIESSNKHHHHH
jgi:Co/Zn/Cd efflux system component